MSERMNASSDLSELEWIEIRSAVKQPDQQLGFWDKFKGKAIENPFIPLGEYFSQNICFSVDFVSNS